MQPSPLSSSRRAPASRRPLALKRRSWRQKVQYAYYRLMRMQGSPQTIARGLAVGVFAGCFPWFGLQTIIAIGLAFLLRGNKIIAAAATWISNPFTYVPLFAFNYQIGHWVMRSENEPFEFSALASAEGIRELGADILLPLFLGSFLMGFVAANVGYWLGLRFIRRARHQRFVRRRRKSPVSQ